MRNPKLAHILVIEYEQVKSNYCSSLSRDPLGYVRLVINTTLSYEITASGEIGTLWGGYIRNKNMRQFGVAHEI